MSHPGHVPAITEARCDTADPAPALEELFAVHPVSMTVAHICDALGGRWHRACLQRVLRNDIRFARVGDDLFTLRSPGIIDYRGLVPEMRAIVQSEGELRVDDLAMQISLAFDVPEERVRAYARMRPFATCNGIVRMRPEHSRAPWLWDLPENETLSLVQVRGGFTYDLYVAACEVTRPEQDAAPVVASLLQLSEDIPTGIAIVNSDESVDGDEVVFNWNGIEVDVKLPNGFLATHAIEADMVVRLHFHGYAGHIKSVSLHVLPADAAIEQRLMLQRVPKPGQWSHELAADMELAAEELAESSTDADSVSWEIVRGAVEQLLLTSYAHCVARESSSARDESGKVAHPSAIEGKPGYCQITMCKGTLPGPRDQWVRWQWTADDTLKIQFGLTKDPVREATECGHLLQKLRTLRGMESGNFTFTTRLRMSDVNPIEMSSLIVAVIRDGMRVTLDDHWFVGHPSLAVAAWSSPKPDGQVWRSEVAIADATRAGFAPARAFEPPAWLGPWIAPAVLENRPLVKPSVVRMSSDASLGRRAASPVRPLRPQRRDVSREKRQPKPEQ